MSSFPWLMLLAQRTIRFIMELEFQLTCGIDGSNRLKYGALSQQTKETSCGTRRPRWIRNWVVAKYCVALKTRIAVGGVRANSDSRHL